LSRVLKSLYHYVVNFNQWFNYGRSWANIPLNILQVTSYVSIILLFLDVEKNKVLMVMLSGVIIAVIFIVGYFLFRSGAEQVDRVMQNWRNTVHELATVGLWYADTLVVEHLGIPVPEELKEFGIEEWEDLKTLYKYVLDKGKKANAVPLCWKFLGKEKEYNATK
jgi:hypothetical protein